MDLLTLRTKIRKILLDAAAPSASRWSDDDLTRFVNEALLEVSRAAKRRQYRDYSQPAGSDRLAVPTDLLSLDVALWKETTGTAWARLSPSEEPYPVDDAEYSSPCYWLLKDASAGLEYFIFRPVRDVDYTVRLVYFYKFPSLVTDTDVPEPVDVDDILINFAVWQALDWDDRLPPNASTTAKYERKFAQQIVAWAAAEQKKYRRRPAQVKVIR